MLRKTATRLLLAMTITTITPSSATAAVRHITAACGMHRGHLVIAGGVDHRYHVRLGAKHAGGRHRCHGRVHRHGNAVLALGGSWVSFDLSGWSFRTILDVGASSVFTASACSAFAGAMIGEVPSGGLDTGATLLTAAACVTGGKHLQDQLRLTIHPRG